MNASTDGGSGSTGTAERLSYWAGVASPTITFGAMLLATVLSPAFAWTEHALSELGGPTGPVATQTTRLLFNGGLIVGALVGFGFGYALLRSRRNRVELAGIGLFGLVAATMGLIGVFPLDHPLHAPVAIAFFVLLSLATWVYGTGNYLAGSTRRGLLTITGGCVNAAGWAVWSLTGEFSRPGLAIPEVVGSVVLSAWAVATALRVRSRLTREE